MKISRIAAGVASLVMFGGLAACGSSDGSGGGDGGFTYGYSQPTGQNGWINTIHSAARSAAGGDGSLMDAKLDPGTAVQQINRFVSEGKDVVVVAPAQVPEAIFATLKDAQQNGAATIGLEWSFSANPTAAPTGPMDGQVSMDRGALGKQVADAVNKANPSGAKVIYVGLPFPVASIDFFQKSLTTALGDSKIVADLDNPSDNAQGALGPLKGALGAHPDATSIVTYNAPSALAAVEAVDAAGLTGKVKIYNIQLDGGSAAAVKAGTIAEAWDLNPTDLGKKLGDMIAAAGAGKPKSEWAKTVLVQPVAYTADTIDSWKNWEKK